MALSGFGLFDGGQSWYYGHEYNLETRIVAFVSNIPWKIDALEPSSVGTDGSDNPCLGLVTRLLRRVSGQISLQSRDAQGDWKDEA